MSLSLMKVPLDIRNNVGVFCIGIKGSTRLNKHK